MNGVVNSMKERGLAPLTAKGRVSSIRRIYKIAISQGDLKSNPATDTVCYTENRVAKRRKRRLPFDNEDLGTIFGSQVYA